MVAVAYEQGVGPAAAYDLRVGPAAYDHGVDPAACDQRGVYD